MKKKFYSGMLMVAMLFATMGSFVSCKDYDEDAYAELQGKLDATNATLEELIQTQREELEKRIKELEDAQKLCAENCSTWQAAMDAWVLWAENNYVTKEVYQQHLNEYAQFLAQYKSDYENLGKRIDDVNTLLEEAKTALNGRIDAALDRISKLDTAIQNVANDLAELSNQVKANTDDLTKAKTDIQNLQTTVGDHTDLINKLDERVKANEDAIAKLNTAVEALQATAKALEDNETIKKANEAYEKANKNADDIAALREEIAKLKQCNCDVDALLAKIDEAKTAADAAKKLAEDNLALAKEYTDQRIQEVVNSVTTLETRVGDLETAYKDADAKLQEQLDALTERVVALETAVKENTEKIDELMGRDEKIEQAMSQFITGVLLQGTENPVFGSFSFPANIQTNVLMAYYGTAGSYGIEFPAKYPRYYVRDNEALTEKDIEMLGITPVMLAQDGETIVGNAGKVYVTVNPSNVNFEGETLAIVNSIEEESGIKLSPLAYSDKKLTFGYSRSAENGLYEAEATLAPEDVQKVNMKFDFDKSDIKETVKDVLNPLNGVNATQVASTVLDVMSQFNQKLDANALKATWTDSLGVTRNTYSQYNLAATAVKPLSYAFLKDFKVQSFPGFDKMQNFVGKILDTMGEKLKVALPEFTFDLNIEKINGIQFDKIDINTSDIDLDITVTYTDSIPVSVPIDIKEYVNYKDTIYQEVELQPIYVSKDIPVKGDVYDKEGNVVGYIDTSVPYADTIYIPTDTIAIYINKNIPFEYHDIISTKIGVKIDVPVDLSQFKKMLDEIEGMEDDINGMLAGQQDNINNIINTINSYLEQLGDLTEIADKFAHIDQEIDDFVEYDKNLIAKYLDKIENKLVNVVNSANKALQPVLVVRTVGGVSFLSQTVYNPTVMSSGNVRFYPTSYTAEIVAPAYKKLVGVTNVYSMDRKKSAQGGDASCLSALRTANSKAGICEILDGDTLSVGFSAERGYIYEIVYTAVDYSGMVAAKKFYVTVK